MHNELKKKVLGGKILVLSSNVFYVLNLAILFLNSERRSWLV